MILLIILIAWTALALLIVGLCLAARLGDLQQDDEPLPQTAPRRRSAQSERADTDHASRPALRERLPA